MQNLIQQLRLALTPARLLGAFRRGRGKVDSMGTIKKLGRSAKFFLFGILVLVCVFLPANLASGQTLTTGQVLGRVTDPSGAAVAGAGVELRDTSTGAVRTTTTNDQGQYVFPQVAPGPYSLTVTASGFERTIVSSVAVEVGKTSTINVSLRLGPVSQVVEVTSTPGAELQTLDATVGNTVGGEALQALPTLDRNTTSLLLLQPLAMPQQFGSQSSRFGGQVAGARSDQNSFLLDGGEITNPTSGNSDYWKAFNGAPEGSIPTPIESVQEFTVETNNPSGSQSLSLGGGAQVVMVTKRGTDQFHGSLYEGYRGAVLNANRWDANRLGQPRPNVVDNRFGASLGGHVLTDAWKTYFYGHYEGRRRHEATFINRLVPTDTLRQGILRFKDNAGNTIRYSLVQPGPPGTLGCGPTGNDRCDPLNFGLNPVISRPGGGPPGLWQLEPPGNDPSRGDGLNTIGFSAFGKLPITSNLGVIRLDHSFGSRFHWTGSYRHYTEDAGIPRQVDIGGIFPGDAFGVPKILSAIPRQPRYLVSGLTTNITPNFTNDVRVSWLRDFWEWNSFPPFPQLSAVTAAALVPGGDTVDALVPVNIDTQGSRNRRWISHGLAVRDDLSWLRGNHTIRFGGSFNHTWVFFRRDDGQQNSQKTLQYFMGNTIGGISFPSSVRPRACVPNPPAGTPAITTNCLPSSQNSTWNNLYAQVLGLVDAATILRARDAQLQLLPQGTDLQNAVRYNHTTVYAQDTWRLRPNLTLTYGIAWAATVPPVEDQGKLMMTVTPSGQLVLPRTYLEQRRQAALAGKVFNLPVGFTPINNTGRKYPFDFVRHNFEPRVALAWQPNFDSGILGTLFSHGKTVVRGGYWHFYDRLNGVQTAIDTLQAIGFGQSLLCLGPDSANAGGGLNCRGNGGTTPLNAFRIGINGSTIKLPDIDASLSPPVVAGDPLFVPKPPRNIAFGPNSFLQDPEWRPGSHNQWDFTIQRELPGRGRLEIGYVGHTARNIYQGIDLNQVPFFMTAGGQTFAQAFDALAADPNLTKNQAMFPVMPQPFFETILKGSTFCPAPNSCSAAVATKFSGDISNQRVRNVFNGIQSAFVTGPATNAATQFSNFFYWSSLAESNYHAGFISYRIRASHGLTLDANVTYGHSLDTVGVNQDTDQAFTNSYDPHYDYGTSLFDRKFVLTTFAVYELPFRSQSGWLKRIIGGWQVSPIVSVASGLPLRVLDGSGQEFGQTSLGAVSEAVRTGSGGTGAGRFRLVPTSGCGTSAGGKNGSGLNIFADPNAVCSQFRPIQLSADRTSRGGTLRGLGAWNVDLSFVKKIAITERTRLTFTSGFFNLFNHVNFLDPAVNLQSPQTFGVITTQGNDPRQIQLGLRFDF